MSYALTTLWHERQRYLTAILAVAFCALLGSVQFGLLLGLFSITSMPVDNSRADIWLGAPKVLGVDLGRPIRESQALARLASHPDIERVEGFLQGFSYWARKDGGQELCMVVGSRLEPGSMGRNTALERYPELAEALTEPGTVVFDESDKEKLGVQKAGDEAEVAGTRVRVVGFVKGAKGLAAPFVFCSLTTARPLLRCFPGQITYALGKVKKGASPEDVVASLRRQYAPAPPKADPLASKDMGALSIQTESQKEAAEENALGQDSQAELSIFTSAEFSRRTRVHWLRPRLRSRSGPHGRRGGHQPNALLRHRCLHQRVRRTQGHGHSPLAGQPACDDPCRLGGYHRHRRSHTRRLQPRSRCRNVGRANETGSLVVDHRLGGHPVYGHWRRAVRPALAARRGASAAVAVKAGEGCQLDSGRYRILGTRLGIRPYSSGFASGPRLWRWRRTLARSR